MGPTLERQMLFRGFCFFLYETRGFIEMIRLVLSSLASYDSDMHTYRRDTYTHTHTHTLEQMGRYTHGHVHVPSYSPNTSVSLQKPAFLSTL